MSTHVRLLGPDDVPLMNALLATFAEAFDDLDAYAAKTPQED